MVSLPDSLLRHHRAGHPSNRQELAGRSANRRPDRLPVHGIFNAMAAPFDAEFIDLHTDLAGRGWHAKTVGEGLAATEESTGVSPRRSGLRESQPATRSIRRLAALSRPTESSQSRSPSRPPVSGPAGTRRNRTWRWWRSCRLLSPPTTGLSSLTAQIRGRGRLVHGGHRGDQLLDGHTKDPSQGAQVPLRWLVDPALPTRHSTLGDAEARGDRGKSEGSGRRLGSLHPDLAQARHAHRVPAPTGGLRSKVQGLKLSTRTFELNTQVVDAVRDRGRCT